ncbi:MAG: hypothetical protein K2O32_15140 [Acetatifactor sp.]|nr:hypothetical protein [Acetatifactor sp.]
MPDFDGKLDDVIEQDTERDSFEIFKSNICHSVKDMGELDFIREILCSGKVFEYYKKEWYAEALYLLAMVDYLSRKNEIPLYGGYNTLRTHKLQEVVYPAGVITMYLLSKDETILQRSYDNAIPEFKRFNIVENEVENIA